MKRAFGFAALVALACAPAQAHAAGLYFSDRGVRPMGRGGAFVAGADDLGAIWYNPAGLVDTPPSVLADFSWLRFSSEYTRELRIVDADGTIKYVSSPGVHGSSPIIPFPTIAAATKLGRNDEWTMAGGVYAPYAALATYPATVGGAPSPARYALGSFDGSALVMVGAWAAYRVSDELRVGLGVGALCGVFQSNITFSVSPQDRLLAAPEQPEYDAAASFRVGPIVAPTGNVGVTWVPSSRIRFGTSFQLPTVVSSSARFDVRLPSGAIFDGARVSGNDAHVRFVLPPVLRLGVEGRPTRDVRVELAYVREFWSMHESIDLTPEGVALENVAGLPQRVPLPAVKFPRNFQDSNSLRLGGEWSFELWSHRMDARAGVSYETSAVPREYLSLLTVDMDKVTVSVGGSIHLAGRLRMDALYGHVFPSNVRVSPDEAKIPRVTPLDGNAPLEAVNGGRYSASADLVGVGLQYTF